MLLPSTNRIVHAVCVLSAQTEIHGHAVARGNVVVEVHKVLSPGVCPLIRSPFDEDEDVYVGGFMNGPAIN